MIITFSDYKRKNLGTIYKDNEIIKDGLIAKVDIPLEQTSLCVNFSVGGECFTYSVAVIDIDNCIINIPFEPKTLRAGLNAFELVAVNGGSSRTSATYNYFVDRSISNTNNIFADTNYPVLIGLIGEVQELFDKVQAGVDLTDYYTRAQVDNKIIEEIQNAQLSGSGSEVDLSAYATKEYVSQVVNDIELTPGPQGEKGEKGEAGPQGIKGDIGERGLQGLKGDTGEKGQQGIQGERGLKGDKGDQGEKGDKGNAFVYSDFTESQLQALKGDKGDTGLKGEKGDKGDVGLQGEKGEQGIQGEKGDAFTYSDFTSSQLEALRGEKGEQGERGIQGEAGAQGLKGDTGARGADGKNGIDGKDGQDGLTTSVNGITHVNGNVTLTAGNIGAYTKSEVDSKLGGLSFWKGTQSQYDALSSKDNSVIYFITA